MIRRAVLLLPAAVLAAAGASAFAPPASHSSTPAARGARCSSPSSRLAAFDGGFDESSTESFDPLNLADEPSPLATTTADGDGRSGRAASLAAAGLAAGLLSSLSSPPSAAAAGPDWGLFEGRTGSLLHPLAMFSAAALTASTALLGFQWRRQRTIGDEIAALKRRLPELRGAGSVTAALEAARAAEDEEVDAAYVSSLEAALGTQGEIDALTRERKELTGAKPRDRHFNQGSLLLFVGIAFAIEGPLNTYARAGKLFPGPHLYAGAGLVTLWALAASMVPAMQKGSDAARAVHIGANVAGIGLFVWQITSGIPILLKVWEFTQWP